MVQTSHPPRSIWERHFQTFVGVTILALGTWLIDTTQTHTIALAVQTERIQTLTIRINSFTMATTDRYTSMDASRDFARRDAELKRIYRRLIALEGSAR